MLSVLSAICATTAMLTKTFGCVNIINVKANPVLLSSSCSSWDLTAVTTRQTAICWLRPTFWRTTVLPGKKIKRFMDWLRFAKVLEKTFGSNAVPVFREKYAMMFDEPVLLQLGWWYVAWARVSGPSSDCGSHGQATITTDDG